MSSDAIQVSSLPLPPMQYVNQYTDELIRRGRAPKPPPPIQDTYHMFGNTFNTEESIIRPLESQVLIYTQIDLHALSLSPLFIGDQEAVPAALR